MLHGLYKIQNQFHLIFRDITITTSTSVLIIGLLILIIISLLLQRFVFFLKQSKQKYNFYRERSIYERGYNAFVQGMVALANRDFKKVVSEAKNANKYLKDKSLGLLLTSEALKVEKKFDQLNDVYEEMLKNPKHEFIRLARVNGTKFTMPKIIIMHLYMVKNYFYLNPRIDKLYETLVNIIGKTNNWQKLIYLSRSITYKL